MTRTFRNLSLSLRPLTIEIFRTASRIRSRSATRATRSRTTLVISFINTGPRDTSINKYRDFLDNGTPQSRS